MFKKLPVDEPPEITRDECQVLSGLSEGPKEMKDASESLIAGLMGRGLINRSEGVYAATVRGNRLANRCQTKMWLRSRGNDRFELFIGWTLVGLFEKIPSSVNDLSNIGELWIASDSADTSLQEFDSADDAIIYLLNRLGEGKPRGWVIAGTSEEGFPEYSKQMTFARLSIWSTPNGAFGKIETLKKSWILTAQNVYECADLLIDDYKTVLKRELNTLSDKGGLKVVKEAEFCDDLHCSTEIVAP